MSLLERFADWRRERYIRALGRQLNRAIEQAWPRHECVEIWAKFRRECLSRSPAQVARMEKAKGLRK